MQIVAALALAALAGACLTDGTTRCADGRLCASGFVCDEAHDSCVEPEQVAACADKEQREACAYRGVPAGACDEGVCLPRECGDGRVDETEVCDDANNLAGDGCSPDCRSLERCRNGILDPYEVCEPNAENASWCNRDCTSAVCGDGHVDVAASEACDEGADHNSNLPNAACRPNCQPSRCGDRVKDDGEACDDGNLLSNDGCSGDCRSNEACGNGIVDTAINEECDPLAPGSMWCRDNCHTMRCGDGVIDAALSELCDAGKDNADTRDAACRTNCQPRRCGDRVVDSGEVCDDGNLLNGDGCSYDCRSRELCGNGYRDPAEEECDDGNLMSHDGCSSECLAEEPAWRAITPPRFNLSDSFEAVFDAARDRIVVVGYAYSRGQVQLEYARGAWSEVDVGREYPRAYYKPALVWEPTRQQTLWFGGGGPGERSATDELWAWDGGRWQRLSAAGAWPPARAAATMVYDAGRRRVVLFGGYDAAFVRLRDSWEWDGSRWEQTASDAPDRLGAAAYDAREGRIVAHAADGLWTYDQAGWHRLELAGPLPGLSGLKMAYDAANARVVLMQHETWALEGSWLRLLSDEAPPGRSDSPLLYSPNARTLLRVSLRDGGTEDALQVAWSTEEGDFRMDPFQWVQGFKPTVAQYQPLMGQVVVFGETAAEPRAARTMTFSGAGWREHHSVLSPRPRTGAAMAHTGAAGDVVLFGGNASYLEALNDTWLWNGTEWSQLDMPDAPEQRTEHAMAFEPGRGRVLMLGGLPANSAEPFDDVWAFEQGAWHELGRGDPQLARKMSTLVYDWSRQRMLLIGDQRMPMELAEEAWIEMEHAAPDSRVDPGLVYNANRHAVMMSGASVGNDWELSASGWSPVPGGPAGADKHTVVFDALHAEVLAFLNDASVHAFRHEASGQREEACLFRYDTDRDGLLGCDDPDCWGYCTPLCPPGASCDASTARCGDGVCNEALETCGMCPGDCGTCAPQCGDFFCDGDETPEVCPGDCATP
jgi:cysteine-rich repeat protein